MMLDSSDAYNSYKDDDSLSSVPSPLRIDSLIKNEKKFDYKKLEKNHFAGAHFIFECGTKLEARPLTIATAAVLYHKFFKEVSIDDYDIYMIGATSLYLAGKVESQCLKLRDIINVCFTTLDRSTDPLELNQKYWTARDAICNGELFMMRTLAFKVTMNHPHRFLVHYLNTLEDWVGGREWRRWPVARTAWSLLQDFYHDDSILEYPPQALAIAVIQFSLQIYEVTIPLTTPIGRNSWQKIFYREILVNDVDDIISKMIELYEKEDKLLN